MKFNLYVAVAMAYILHFWHLVGTAMKKYDMIRLMEAKCVFRIILWCDYTCTCTWYPANVSVVHTLLTLGMFDVKPTINFWDLHCEGSVVCSQICTIWSTIHRLPTRILQELCNIHGSGKHTTSFSWLMLPATVNKVASVLQDTAESSLAS